MAKTRKNEILMTNDGFYFGYKLKNGRLNKNARRISEDEIMNMFMFMFSAYCAKTKTDSLVVAKDGYGIAVKEIVTETGG